MITGNLLMELYHQHVEALAAEKGLTHEEKERILAVFQRAMANSFMDERQIYLKLTGQEEL